MVDWAMDLSAGRDGDGRDAVGRSGAVCEALAHLLRAEFQDADIDSGGRRGCADRSSCTGALQARHVEAALVRSGGDEAEELDAILGWLLK